MRITDVKSTVIGVPYNEPEPWAWGIGHYGVTAIIVEILTDEEFVGIGEGTNVHASTEYGGMIIDSSKKLLVGEDPFDIERIHWKMDAVVPRNLVAKCGIDLAAFVASGPAETALTRTCSRPYSRANARTRASSAALLTPIQL